MSQPDNRKDYNLLIAFFVAMGIIFVLLMWIIFKTPNPALFNGRSKEIRDSITLLTTQIEDQKKITDHYLAVADSLRALPPKIKIIYRDKKKFTSTASINQLDSLIRVLSGISKTR